MTASRPSGTRGTSAPRILALDVVRGVAVAGILFVNAPPLLDTAGGFVDGHPTPVREFLDMAVQQRFFPIFSLLFGIGFGLMWNSAVGRAPRPRVVMLRRLLLLLLLGIGHAVLQPGEALLPYAIFGLVLLLPVTFLTDTKGVNGALLVLGLIGVASAAAIGGGAILVPTLLLVGWALARLGLVARFTGSHTVPVIGAVVFTVLAVPALWWQAKDPINAGFNASSAVAGLVMAAAYACIVCALLPTRAGHTIALFIAPLGRTALSSYVSATLIIVAVRELSLPGGITIEHALGLDAGTSTAWIRLMVLCGCIVLVQAIVSALWLRRFRQGPLEWVWRAVTWWTLAPAWRR